MEWVVGGVVVVVQVVLRVLRLDVQLQRVAQGCHAGCWCWWPARGGRRYEGGGWCANVSMPLKRVQEVTEAGSQATGLFFVQAAGCCVRGQVLRLVVSCVYVYVWSRLDARFDGRAGESRGGHGGHPCHPPKEVRRTGPPVAQRNPFFCAGENAQMPRCGRRQKRAWRCCSCCCASACSRLPPATAAAGSGSCTPQRVCRRVCTHRPCTGGHVRAVGPGPNPFLY